MVVLREATWWRAIDTALRIAILTLGACLWWMAGLLVEAAYGVNVLKYTETVPSTSATSSPSEVIRGLGYWFFYGGDSLGPWTNSAARYTQSLVLLATSYAVPVFSVVAAAFVRWRERAFFIVLIFVGLVLSVGPFPFTNPTVIGRLFKSFMTNTTAGLALRSTDRATPVVLLGLVMLLGRRRDGALAARFDPRDRLCFPAGVPRRRQQPLDLQRRHDRQLPVHPGARRPPTRCRRSPTSTTRTKGPASWPSRATTSRPIAGVIRSTRHSPHT